MLVKINDVLYEIPNVYTYESKEAARTNSMNFSLCRFVETVNAMKWTYFYRGNEVKVEFVNQ